MTDQHPLTDETCDGLVWFSRDGLTELSEYDYVIMRAAYDKGMEDQLERVIEWVHPILESEHLRADYFVESLREAMRPQETP